MCDGASFIFAVEKSLIVRARVLNFPPKKTPQTKVFSSSTATKEIKTIESLTQNFVQSFKRPIFKNLPKMSDVKPKRDHKNRRRTCAVAVCRSRPPGTWYHRFPKDPKLQEIWIQACRREAPVNLNTAYVCSRHFLETDFQRDLFNELLGLPTRHYLISGAIPTLHLLPEKDDDDDQTKKTTKSGPTNSKAKDGKTSVDKKQSSKRVKKSTAASVKSVKKSAAASVKTVKKSAAALAKNVKKPTAASVKNVKKSTAASVKNVKKPTAASVKNVKKSTAASVKTVKKPTAASDKNDKKPTAASVKNVKKSAAVSVQASPRTRVKRGISKPVEQEDDEEESEAAAQPASPGPDTSLSSQSSKVAGKVKPTLKSAAQTNPVPVPEAVSPKTVPTAGSVPVSAVGVTSSSLPSLPESGPKTKVAQIIFDAPSQSYWRSEAKKQKLTVEADAERARAITQSFSVSSTDLLWARIHELEDKVAQQQKIIGSMCFACQKRLLNK